MAGIDVAAVGAVPAIVPLGYADLGLVFDVHNPTAVAASLDGVAVSYSAGAFLTGATVPALPAPLPAGPIRPRVRAGARERTRRGDAGHRDPHRDVRDSPARR